MLIVISSREGLGDARGAFRTPVIRRDLASAGGSDQRWRAMGQSVLGAIARRPPQREAAGEPS